MVADAMVAGVVGPECQCEGRTRSLSAATELLRRAVAAASIETADDEKLAATLRSLRRAEAVVAGAVVSVGARARQLAEAGTGPPPEERLLADGRVRSRTAREEARRSEALAWIPALTSAVADGLVGADHLDAVVTTLRSLTDDERSRLDGARLAADAVRLPVDTFAASLRRAVRDAAPDAPAKDAEAKRRDSEFRHWWDDRTGMGCFRGRLDPERYELLASAIDRRTSALAAAADGQTSKDANLAAAALIDLLTGSGSGADVGGSTGAGSGDEARIGGVVGRVAGRAPSAQIIVVVADGQTAQTSSGHELPDAAVQRLGCDAMFRRVTLDTRGVPIDVGRAHRTATDGQWAAIRALHSSCAWHGCRARIDWCQLHHLRPWSRGGRTDLHNLVPLCSHHHHRVHEGGWTIELLENRALRIVRPDGQWHTTTDPPSRWPSPLRDDD